VTGTYWPRLCKNVQRDRYSKPDWKSRFYTKFKSAGVPINFKFNVDARTSILATRFFHTLGRLQPVATGGNRPILLKKSDLQIG